MLKKRLAELLYVAAPKAASGAFTLLLNLVLVRWLGAEEFGAYALCLTSLIVVDYIVGGAVDLAVMRFAPVRRLQDPMAARAIEAVGLVVKLIVAIATVPALALAAPWLSQEVLHTPRAVSLMWVTLLATAGLLILRSTLAHLQVEHNFRAYGRVEWLHVVVKYVGAGLVVVFAQAQASTLMMAWALAPLVAVAAGGARIWYRWWEALRAWQAPARDVLHHLRWYMPTLLVGIVLSRMDMYVLTGRAGIAEAGLFAAAATVALAPELLGTYLGVVMAPRIMPKVEDRAFLAMYRRIQSGLLLAAVLAMTLAWYALPPILQAYFPPHFAAAEQVTLVLLLGAFAGMLAHPVLVPFLLFQRPRFMLVLDGLLIVPALGAYVAAIDAHGALGAAWVTTGVRILRTLIAHVLAMHCAKALAADAYA